MDINKYPIFHEPWWLDITAGKNNWGECTVSNQNEIIAKMPWFRKKKIWFYHYYTSPSNSYFRAMV